MRTMVKMDMLRFILRLLLIHPHGLRLHAANKPAPSASRGNSRASHGQRTALLSRNAMSMIAQIGGHLNSFQRKIRVLSLPSKKSKKILSLPSKISVDFLRELAYVIR
jgi:hypothetical protein